MAEATEQDKSAEIAAKRKKEIEAIKDADERKIVELYENGTQTFAIAKEVYKFANSDTVAQVVGIIRKHYADDYNEVESLKDYKGYIGI